MVASPLPGSSRILRGRGNLSSLQRSELQSCIKNLIVFLAYLKFIFTRNS
jgi:hypothetical protein